jgi:hypothetical protein
MIQEQITETLDFKRVNVDEPAVLAFVLKSDFSGDLGKQRVIGAHAYVETHFETRAPLADEDAARSDGLTAKSLHAKALCLRIAAIPAGANSFFMSHEKTSLSLSLDAIDALDADF